MILDIVKLSVIFTLIDSVFLYLMSGKFQKMIKNIQGSELKMSLIPTILCYIFLIFLSLLFYRIKKRINY